MDWQTLQFFPFMLSIHLETLMLASILADSLLSAETANDFVRLIEYPQQSHWIVVFALSLWSVVVIVRMPLCSVRRGEFDRITEKRKKKVNLFSTIFVSYILQGIALAFR